MTLIQHIWQVNIRLCVLGSKLFIETCPGGEMPAPVGDARVITVTENAFSPLPARTKASNAELASI
jgi:hypothetical protein